MSVPARDLPAFAKAVTTLLGAAGHPQATGVWDDGYEISATGDQRAVRITYAVHPAHRADTSNHFRSRNALEDCARLLDEAGQPVTRSPVCLPDSAPQSRPPP
jgi:hypothetical protein